MAKGDHIYVWRNHLGVPFQHHGIDVGDGTVVHFTNGDGGIAGPGGDASEFVVTRTAMSVITLDGQCEVHVVQHRNGFDAETIVQRAISHVGRLGYHLLLDNCEHFANWCASGQRESGQVSTACKRLSAASFKAVATSAIRTVSRLGTKRIIRGANASLLAAEAAQWATELGGHHVGLRDPKQRRRAGQAIGGATAIGIGALGGPIGIAVAGSIWVTGELAGEASHRVYEQIRQRRNMPTGSSS